MLRTVFINRGDAITAKDDWLHIVGTEVDGKVPVEDVYSVIIDNPQVQFSCYAVDRLCNQNAHIVLCNEKHLPTTVILPLNRHYRPYGVFKMQIALTKREKNAIWQKIITSKIENQLNVMKHANVNAEAIVLLEQYSKQVRGGDPTNREGLAAKVFFRAMYGSSFVRMSDDGVNAALNYGYAILRSSVAKSLTAYGFNCAIGIHHIGENNPFNLADDLMEPLRPLVDLWVDENQDTLVDELTMEQRKALVALINRPVLMTGKKMNLVHAIERYVAGFSSAIENNDCSRMSIPQIHPRFAPILDEDG